MHKIIIETQYLPPIEYFTTIIKYEYLVIEAHEHYQKRSYRNRCHIANSQGVQPLSIPLKSGKNAQTPIREVRIAYDMDWQKQHWQSIKTAYGSSPFWEHYSPVFEKFYLKKYAFLFDFNLDILNTIFKNLKLNNYINISFTNTYEKIYTVHRTPNGEGVDFRNQLTPLKPSTFNSLHYNQVFEDKTGYIPNLSILDLLMCCGPQALDILKKNGNYSHELH